MMQSCASAAKLRGGGPILNRGSKTMCKVGLPSVRHLQLDINTRTNCRTSSCVPVSKVVTLPGEGADLPAPRRWSPTAKAQ
jgi:hypothetical protein